MRIYKIGQSAQGEDLIAVEMWAENEDDDEVKEYDEMPESRLMGNIHGNEDQGVFILMPLINEYSIATSTYSVRGFQVQFHLWTNCDCRFRTLRIEYRTHWKDQVHGFSKCIFINSKWHKWPTQPSSLSYLYLSKTKIILASFSALEPTTTTRSTW